jgi:hypothetical protein
MGCVPILEREGDYMGKAKTPKLLKFGKEVMKGTGKGLGRLASDTATGVLTELFSILTLQKRPKR